jgi:hypothetical protein
MQKKKKWKAVKGKRREWKAPLPTKGGPWVMRNGWGKDLIVYFTGGIQLGISNQAGQFGAFESILMTPFSAHYFLN